jgi:hypothetical protein
MFLKPWLRSLRSLIPAQASPKRGGSSRMPRRVLCLEQLDHRITPSASFTLGPNTFIDGTSADGRYVLYNIIPTGPNPVSALVLRPTARKRWPCTNNSIRGRSILSDTPTWRAA